VSIPELEELRETFEPSYVLERELGRGGMATVYLARDTKHARLVALKVLHADLAAALGPERFQREITTAAALQHPHILGVYDSGKTASGQLWFTMPFVDGETLRDRLQHHRQLPVEDALRIAHEIASALDYAHGQGVLHRDIKPENILLTRQGEALLADFGIARALEVEAGPAVTPLTQTGVVVGTAQYMSPEQASGDPALDAASDVYSLAAVLYEMLAGEPPFTGPTTRAIVAKMMSRDPASVRVTRPVVSVSIDTAIRRALAPVSADRWPSAGEFARALTTAERAPSRRRIPVTAMTLSLGLLAGLGLLFAWRAHGRGGAGPIRLAVLPFTNMGDTSDAYFADGVTDAVRGKLTSVAGLQVIGSASSEQYRKTSKTPEQIARELGVRYLLIGKVRWDKHGPESQVEVSPELVDARSATDAWAEPFDEPLTHVFQMQSNIAGKVAEKLQVALTPAAQRTLTERPTSDLLAYDAYLRGEALLRTSFAPVVLRRAIAAFREAVARDSAFALAWSSLGSSYTTFYVTGVPSPAIADSADHATARALALAPDLSAAHAARAFYYSSILIDNTRALAEAQAGLARGPSSGLLFAAANAEEGLGRWDSAAALFAQGTQLDPRDPVGFDFMGFDALFRRRPTDARAAAERALAIQPDDLRAFEASAMASLQAGDLAGARAVLRRAPSTVDPSALVAFTATYFDLGWILDSAQTDRLLSLRPEAFGNDSANWALVLAQQYGFREDRARMLAYADTARAAFAAQLRAAPNDGQRHVLFALALAYLGRSSEAIREGEQGARLYPMAQNASTAGYFQHQLARIYLLSGQPERALDVLERLMQTPYFLTPAWLRIDPNFVPLHGNPRFERLVGGGPVA
jgi:TolB-like protein/tetratricopeptide (TPR) repeat protein